MKKVLKHPEIINPYNVERNTWKDSAFIKDLGIDELLDFVEYCSSNAKAFSPFAKKVLVDTGSDMRTVEYRQAVFKDLTMKPTLRQSIQEYIHGLYGLAKNLEIFSKVRSLGSGLILLRNYREFLDKTGEISDVKSTALKQVAVYFNDIKASNEFVDLCELLKGLEDSSEVTFRVSLDEGGSPLTMYAMDIVQKKPEKNSIIMSLVEKILRKKRGEQNLRKGRDLNEIGKIVQSYMDKQFIPLVSEYVTQIREITKLLNPLDFYASFADYFVILKEIGFDVCKPVLLPIDQRSMNAKSARNPLLLDKRKMAMKNRRNFSQILQDMKNDISIVPNDIFYNANENMFTITGPNNGGKTTFVRTVGLVQLMSQTGLFAPAKSVELSFVDGIYTHFVSPDDITKGEGRYRNELRRMKEILERATPYSFVILDEPCGGTSYEEGLRQSIALLDGFHKLGSITYFTTHMHAISKEVDKGRYKAAKNLSVECIGDGAKLTYTYKIKSGASNKSYGEEIAKEIGLTPENIVNSVFERAEKQGFGKILRK